MIDQISFLNFKGFKELKELKIKPVTVLCGTNSSGKSSILQNILLLKQTLESKDPNQTLLLNGRFAIMGTFVNMLYEKKFKNELTIEYRIKIKPDDMTDKSFYKVLYYLLIGKENRDSLEGMANESKVVNSEYIINYKFILSANKNNKQASSFFVKEMSFNFESHLNDEPTKNFSIAIIHEQNNNYSLNWKNLPIKSKSDARDHTRDTEVAQSIVKEIMIEFSNLLPDFIPFIEGDGLIDFDWLLVLFSYLAGLYNLLKNILSSYSYIGPLRLKPERIYYYENEAVEIGIRGENAPYLYFVEQDKIINGYYYYDHNNEKFTKENSISLSSAVSQCLNGMHINNFNVDNKNEIFSVSMNSTTSKETRVSIADAGFGVSQIFPIILEGLRMPERNTLMLEQPEIHLHPNLQMDLADYIISLALSNKRVIIETHSDHIINRMVRRIVEDDTYNLKDLIAIYFLTPSDDGIKCEEIKIDDKKGILNWPDDFFGQVASEQEKIIQAGWKKRQKYKSRQSSSL